MEGPRLLHRQCQAQVSSEHHAGTWWTGDAHCWSEEDGLVFRREILSCTFKILSLATPVLKSPHTR